MSMVLTVSSSAFRGNVGWAWSLCNTQDDGADTEEQAPQTDSGAFTDGSAYRGAMAAAIAGLNELDDGLAVAVRTSNDTLVRVGADWMALWRERDWDKPGGIKHLDLVRLLSEQDTRLQLTWSLHKSTEDSFKAVKSLAQKARKTLPDPPEAAAKVAKSSEPMAVAPTVMRTVAYTDGGCRGNPGGVGGWGLLLIDTRSGAALERWGGEKDTTNNRMEMMAAIEVLRTVKGRGQSIEIRTDSKYLHDAATSWIAGWKRRGWRKGDGEAVANVDLCQQIDELQGQHNVKWTWVRGHQGEPGNEHADALANRAMDALGAEKDPAGSTRFAQSPVTVLTE